jgi:hypothetical protein
MKNQFELFIYLSDIHHLLNLDETLRITNKPAPEYTEVLDDNLLINQYSLIILRDYMYKQFGLHYEGNIEGIYFGQETCENLIPTLKHVQQGLDYCREHEYSFTLTTPYTGPKGMSKLLIILEYLDKEAPGTEVVVNDYGVLHLINKKLTSLKPLLGRLLIKMKRDPRFSMSGYDIANADIKNLKKVESNQKDALQGTSLELPVYQEFLRSKGIERVCIDTVTQGLNPRTSKKWGFPVDLLWPWTYVTSSRSCSIAAHTQLGKEYHPTDEPCKFQCKKYQYVFSSDKRMLPAAFRGNATWIDTRSLYEEFFKLGLGRLIYEPYIPV